jgi:hypothetical protein
MANDHTGRIIVNVSLAPLATSSKGFGTTLFIRDGITLGGAQTKRYTDPATATVDLAAGIIDATTRDAIVTAFSQTTRRPLDFLVGKIDIIGGDTYTTGFALIEADDPDFYGVTIDSRVDAIILEVSALIEASTPKYFYMMQSDDTDWDTVGLPAALTALAGRERTGVVFHDTDTEFNDVGWTTSRLSFDPDTESAAWPGEVKDVNVLSPLPDATARANLKANFANVGLAFGAAPFFMFEGVNAAGRPIDHVVTGDWFAARLSERSQDLMVALAARGQKLPVDPDGQTLVLNLINGLLQEGVAANHFIDEQTTAVAETITAADITAQLMRFTVSAQVSVNANNLTFGVFFSTTPVSS